MQKEEMRLSSYQEWPHYDHALPTRLARDGFSYTREADQVQCFRCSVRGSPRQEHLEGSPSCLYINRTDTTYQAFTATLEAPFAHAELSGTGHLPTQISQSSSAKCSNGHQRSLLCVGTAEIVESQANQANQAHADKNATTHDEQRATNLACTLSKRAEIKPHDSTKEIQPEEISSHRAQPVETTPALSSCSLVFRGMPGKEREKDAVPHYTDEPRHAAYCTLESRIDTYATWPADKEQSSSEMAEAGFFFTGQQDYVRCYFCHGGLLKWLPGDDPFIEHARWFPKCTYIARTQGASFARKVRHGENVLPRSPFSRTEQGDAASYREEEDKVQENTTVPSEEAETLVPLIQEEPPNSKVTFYSSDEYDTTPGTKSTRTKPKTKSKDLRECFISLFEEKLELEAENKAMKDSIRCKVCMDEDVCIVFLPCGHRVTCSSCATNLGHCPICRSFIVATVKARLV